METEVDKKIADHWSSRSSQKNNEKLKLRWWQSPLIKKHINRVVSGKPFNELSQGLNNRVMERYKDSLPFERGISVACGSGGKEMRMIKQNIVTSFDLYELSKYRIEVGTELAKKFQVENQVRFFKKDALKSVVTSNEYDIVHWNNALHHMFDVDKAVEWSKRILKKGGLFYLDDFVGPTRFQWSDRALAIASRIRSVFSSTKYLTNPLKPNTYLPTRLYRPDADQLIAQDPSEAADSQRILGVIRKYFPNAEIRATGGIVYSLVLSDMINNFDENTQEDKLLLELLMVMDELCIGLCETQYATAIAIKED